MFANCVCGGYHIESEKICPREREREREREGGRGREGGREGGRAIIPSGGTYILLLGTSM